MLNDYALSYVVYFKVASMHIACPYCVLPLIKYFRPDHARIENRILQSLMNAMDDKRIKIETMELASHSLVGENLFNCMINGQTVFYNVVKYLDLDEAS